MPINSNSTPTTNLTIPSTEVANALMENTESTEATYSASLPANSAPNNTETADLLRDLSTAFSAYVIMPNQYSDILAAWAMHSHVYQNFHHTPRVAILSPDKQCGKSTVIELLRITSKTAQKADSISAAAMFRLVDSSPSLSLLIDESDTFLPGNEALRGILNSGFERSGTAMRAGTQADGFAPATYKTFAPVAIAAIGKLSATIADRSIPITLKRKLPDEKVKRGRQGYKELEGLSSRLSAWEKAIDLAPYSDPDMPENWSDRQQDISVPLVAIADAAGGEWPERIRQALSMAFKGSNGAEETTNYAELLLADLKKIFGANERLHSKCICDNLIMMEGSPWAEYSRGRPISPHGLAKLLHPFGIRPSVLRINKGEPLNGYERSQFDDAWKRYTPDDNATESTDEM